jgi:hypothetical protein
MTNVETKDLQSRQKGLDVVSSVNQEGDGNDVSDDIGRRLEGRSVVTVSTGKVSDRKSRNSMGKRTHGIASSNCLTVKLGTMNLIVSSFSGSRGRELTACHPWPP